MYESNPTLSVLSPVIGYDGESHIFFNDDKTLGFSFECYPLSFSNDELEKQLKAFLALDFPVDTTVQFCLYRSPDIDAVLDAMVGMRLGFYDKLLTPMLYDRAKFLREHTEKPVITSNGRNVYDCGKIVDIKLFITIKIPVSDGISPKMVEIERAQDLQKRSLAALSDCGFLPKAMDADRWLRVMGTFVNWGPTASWKDAVIKADPNAPLNEQFYDHDTDLDDEDPSRSYISLHERFDSQTEDDGERKSKYECYVQMLSPKTYPEAVYFGQALSYIGDTMGHGKSSMISGNYAVISTIRYVNHDAAFSKIKSKRSITSKAAIMPMLVRARPELADAMRDYDTIYEAVKDGDKIIEFSFSVMIFAQSMTELVSVSQGMIQYFSTMNFKLMIDRFIQREMFVNCLPMCTDRKFLFGAESSRFLTLTNSVILPLLPIFGEWKGTGTPHVALISRTGQIMTLSLHDSSTNMNATIAAESGSGKSFYTNELLSMYMSGGAKVWVIDIGRSYLKLCNILGGQFISFDEEHLPHMNPFKMIRDIQEEHDSIIAILENMISPRTKLSDTQSAVLNRIFDEGWRQYGDNLSIDIIQNMLEKEGEKQNDLRVKDMATQIYPYTTRGRYGNVFNGESNIDFNNRFTVLELEELNGFPDLRQVVLLQLIFQIQQQIFLSNNSSQKKIVMIDEAWDLLKQGQTATFMEHAYRKFRKYGASAIIATQSLNDLYNGTSGVGKAIAENSAFNFLLGQKSETVEQVRKAGYMDLTPGGFEILKTVHTVAGAFSEIFIKNSAGAVGIGRLIVSEFEKLMFSTRKEDTAAINEYVKHGLNYTQAIEQVLIDRGIADEDRVKRANELEDQNYGRRLSPDEVKALEDRKHKIVSDDEIADRLNSFKDPETGRLVRNDGSNVRNPRYEDPVMVPESKALNETSTDKAI